MNLSEVNVTWFRTINNLGKDYPAFNPVFEFFAEYTVYILVLGLLGFWFTTIKKNRIMTINAAIAFILAEIIGKIAALLYSNNQPFAELSNVNQLVERAVDNSFPSDHTILMFSVCFSIWLVKKKQGVVWLVIAFATGISRIGVGVHYPFDVIVGATIAIIAAILINWGNSKLYFSNWVLSIYEKIENSILPTRNRSKDV
ncbi:undecaprenyl-diphosphatase [Bacillus marasmi]|uniref:undecaprenyl-diphosphatase n=1 Tax=Bacillus marasmi TaxID=1926279 RepID=UPI0011C9B0B7|nr:undecaprenyl-diphosphatase [Bacillus marasmi]